MLPSLGWAGLDWAGLGWAGRGVISPTTGSEETAAFIIANYLRKLIMMAPLFIPNH